MNYDFNVNISIYNEKIVTEIKRIIFVSIYYDVGKRLNWFLNEYIF